MSKQDDVAMRERIYNVLNRSLKVDAKDVQVTVEDKTVILKGFVQTRAEKYACSRELENYPGVEDLINKIEVKRPFDELIPGSGDHQQERLIENRSGLI